MLNKVYTEIRIQIGIYIKIQKTKIYKDQKLKNKVIYPQGVPLHSEYGT